MSAMSAAKTKAQNLIQENGVGMFGPSPFNLIAFLALGMDWTVLCVLHVGAFLG